MDFFTFDLVLLFESLPSASNPFSVMLLLFTSGGWVVFIFVFIWGAWIARVEFIRNRYSQNLEYVLLAIDVPKMNEQSPKAVEHIFAHLYGIRKSGNLKEKYLKGYTQPSISLEIVSLEGFIQFLIRAPIKFRDLVEAAIYAQYPEAEITEVDDYIDLIPKPLEFPHPEWDIFGTQYKMTKNQAYPIKTYPFFEHSLSQKLMDPMAALMETMSRLGPGEHIWIQIIISPEKDKWKEAGIQLINKLIGKKSEKSSIDWMYFPREVGRGLGESFMASIVPPTEMESANQKKGEREWPSQMQHLSPLEREIVESIGIKIGKLGFMTKVRFIYAAKKNVMNTGRGAYAVNGTFAQFSSQTGNSFSINKKVQTKINYFFIKRRLLARKRRLLWAYRDRGMKRGRKGSIFNIEELATIWHFPVTEVGIASVQSVDAKKAQPPAALPVETSPLSSRKSEATNSKNAPPINLPTS